MTPLADDLAPDERERSGAASRTLAAPDSSVGTIAKGRPGQPLPPEQRRNIVLLGLDMAIFMMALGAIGQLTIIPLFVSRLTDSSVAVGAVTAAFQLGWLPQVFVAGYV